MHCPRPNQASASAPASPTTPILPPAVAAELAQLEQRLGQVAHAPARRALAKLGEAAAVEALRKIGKSREVRTLSGYISWMARKELAGCDAGAKSFAFDRSIARPAIGGPFYQDHDHMEVDTEMISGLTPSPTQQQMDGPSRRTGLATSRENENSLRAKATPQMLALGELEFDRIFLIQVYLADKKIEDVIVDPNYVRYLKSLPMDCFEAEIWNKFGEKFLPASDRRKYLDRDPNKTRMYHCNIGKKEKDDSIITTFKGPYLESTRTHLQKVLGDDNVLVVKFADIDMQRSYPISNNFGYYCLFYRDVGKDGILLGLRRYRFFIYKDGGKGQKQEELDKKEKNKKCSSSVMCYFVRTESGWDTDEPYKLSGYTIDQARRLFMHIHTAPTLAKYISRFSLILSKTIKLDLDFMKIHVEIIDDEPCKDAVDSKELQHSNSAAQHPLLMQFRMFYNGCAVKGTLLVDKRLPAETIRIRPSMIKINTDPKLLGYNSFNSLEIVTTSNRPKRALTSRFLIALLHHGGVKAEYFVYLLRKALEEVKNARHTTRDSLEVAFNHADMDDSMSARMILSGIQPENEAYLEHQLALMIKQERKGLQEGRIPVDECYYLMGTTDPTGTLKPDQVCIILDHGQISGKVLVYKHPGLHFGDIHELTATYIDGLEKVVGNSKYAIFFPTSGSRSLADEMANSDFDGDMYWVSRNPQLLEQFSKSDPWVRRSEPKIDDVQNKPEECDVSKLEGLLFSEFLRARFTPSYVMGTAANFWLALMDRLLTENVSESERNVLREDMLDLVDIYYLALDAPKEGNKVGVPAKLKVTKYPHFMEREQKFSYHSTSVLGKIYDEVKLQESETVSPIKITPLECFTEEAVAEEYEFRWRCLYQEYLKESAPLYQVDDKDIKNTKFRALYQKYKRILYDAEEFEASLRSHTELFQEACAIYQVVYQLAMPRNEVRKCGFVWKVAGRALCRLYAMKRGGDTALCSFPVLEGAFRRPRA